MLSEPCNAEKFSNKGLIIALFGKSFFFSHYYRVCQELDQYSKIKFNDQQYSVIQNKLENILEELGVCFLKMYQTCYLKHQNNRIFQEYRFISQLFEIPDRWPVPPQKNDILNHRLNLTSSALKSFDLIVSNLPIEFYENYLFLSEEFSKKKSSLSKNLADINNPKDKVHSINEYKASIGKDNTNQTHWLNSKLLLGDGTFMNDLKLYQIAIPLLTASIEANPFNKEAFIERALSYFETNQLVLSLRDFESAKKLTVFPPFKLTHNSKQISPICIPTKEFALGLILGTIEGGKVSVVEFVPSLCSCFRGTLNGLWAFACKPEEVSKELIAATYAIGEFINKHSAEECLQCVVPELKELANSWNTMDDYLKGQKIGFIIGKYGVDIFAPVAVINGISKLRALKRANIMYTLETCVSSELNQAKIVEECVKRAVAREFYITESIKKGKILVGNSNVQYHVMQKKHAWEKVLKLSGKVEEDFKKVILLLEESSILSEECFLSSKKFAQNKIIRSDYKKTINGHTIHAVFETYVETNLSYLQDAWVITL